MILLYVLHDVKLINTEFEYYFKKRKRQNPPPKKEGLSFINKNTHTQYINENLTPKLTVTTVMIITVLVYMAIIT